MATAETAAALIESWARPGIAEPLLERRAPVAAAAPVATLAAPAPPAESGARWTPTLRLDAETTGGDRALWLGAAVGVCGRVGPFCLGGEARIAHQLDGAHAAPGWPDRSLQSDLQGLLLVEIPISLGRPVLLLGAGAGLGWRHDGDDGRLGIRQELRATLALPLWSKLAVDAGVTAGVGPRPSEEGRPEERWVSRGQLRFGLGLRWGMP